MPQTQNPCKSPFRDNFLWVHRDMNRKRNMMDRATFELLQRNSTTLPRYSKYYSRSTNEFRSFRKPKFQQQTQFEKRCSKKLLPFLSEGSSVRWAVQANKQTLYTRCLYSCLYISLHFILVSWLEPHTVAFQTLKETQVSPWALSKKA